MWLVAVNKHTAFVHLAGKIAERWIFMTKFLKIHSVSIRYIVIGIKRLQSLLWCFFFRLSVNVMFSHNVLHFGF
jgi:hypothetical protein